MLVEGPVIPGQFGAQQRARGAGQGVDENVEAAPGERAAELCQLVLRARAEREVRFDRVAVAPEERVEAADFPNASP